MSEWLQGWWSDEEWGEGPGGQLLAFPRWESWRPPGGGGGGGSSPRFLEPLQPDSTSYPGALTLGFAFVWIYGSQWETQFYLVRDGTKNIDSPTRVKINTSAETQAEPWAFHLALDISGWDPGEYVCNVAMIDAAFPDRPVWATPTFNVTVG